MVDKQDTSHRFRLLSMLLPRIKRWIRGSLFFVIVLRLVDEILLAVNTNLRCTHPVKRYLGTAIEEESLNIFLEFVPGGSILSLLAKFGSFPESVIRMYTKQILLRLEYLHKNGIMLRVYYENSEVTRGGIALKFFHVFHLKYEDTVSTAPSIICSGLDFDCHSYEFTTFWNCINGRLRLRNKSCNRLCAHTEIERYVYLDLDNEVDLDEVKKMSADYAVTKALATKGLMPNCSCSEYLYT
ncbi:NPK1-related protein kinase 3 [Artemisia annua]|uniref:NPK1-related protein kinase 3 n=1 Tax=Artemisia annua TaxID=35608 RepID=A0A2U1P877_ARTAN|nr:NPK1-related protein kinase 3 [Artemisia annua]